MHFSLLQVLQCSKMSKTLNKIEAKFYLKLFLKYHFIIPKKNYFFNARNLAVRKFGGTNFLIDN